jgi:protocatechuate 3,4-dioxygenase beta subunit
MSSLLRPLTTNYPGQFSYELLLPHLSDWPKQQAMVLDRAGKQEEAAHVYVCCEVNKMEKYILTTPTTRLATKCSFEEAEAYARRVENVVNVFDMTFDGIIATKSPQEAVLFLSRNFDHVDVPKALVMLPDEMTLESLFDLMHVRCVVFVRGMIVKRQEY